MTEQEHTPAEICNDGEAKPMDSGVVVILDALGMKGVWSREDPVSSCDRGNQCLPRSSVGRSC